jgi:hypothetical protein
MRGEQRAVQYEKNNRLIIGLFTFPESLAISGFGTACVEANRATKTT